MERIVLFNDYANTNAAFQNRGVQSDYGDLREYLGEGRFVVEAHAYVPIDPRNPHGRDRQIESLWQSGWLVHTKIGATAGATYKCDFDVEITLDLMRTAEIVKPDIIVLLSGDKDFVPVMLELRRRGIRVEVAAFERGNAARELTVKASGFINLDEYLNTRGDEQRIDDGADGDEDLEQSGSAHSDHEPSSTQSDPAFSPNVPD